MMNLVHAALRRDLVRTEAVLSAPITPTSTRLRALAAHLVWYVDFLHGHHTIEDDHLYPQLAAKRPDVHDLLVLMDREHHAIAPALADLQQLATQIADAPEPDSRAAELRGAATDLRRVLDPHLTDEEEQLMPLVEESLTEREWRDYDRRNMQKPPAELAFIGHWLLDGLDDPDDRAKLMGQLPAPVAWVLVNLLGGRYRRHWAATWADTPAAGIGSQPLPRLRQADGVGRGRR